MNVSYNSNGHFMLSFVVEKYEIITNNNEDLWKISRFQHLSKIYSSNYTKKLLIDRIFLSVGNVVFIQFRVRVSKMSSRVTEDIPWRRLSSSLLAKSLFIKYFASISLLFKYSCNKLIYGATFVDVNLFKTNTNILNVMIES